MDLGLGTFSLTLCCLNNSDSVSESLFFATSVLGLPDEEHALISDYINTSIPTYQCTQPRALLR